MARGDMNHGTHCALRNSIYIEPGGVCAHCFLVCSAALVQVATRDGPGTVIVGPCISHSRRDDPGSRLGRGWCTDGIPSYDRIWRPGNCLSSLAGIDRFTSPLSSRDCMGLAIYDCWESGYAERHYSIRALQCVQ